MSKIPDVVDGEPIESAWGNQSIRDRTVQRMDTVADRDASIPAPGDGETVWIQDINELQIWDGSKWLGIVSADDAEAFLKLTGGTMVGDITMSQAFRIWFANQPNTYIRLDGNGDLLFVRDNVTILKGTTTRESIFGNGALETVAGDIQIRSKLQVKSDLRVGDPGSMIVDAATGRITAGSILVTGIIQGISDLAMSDLPLAAGETPNLYIDSSGKFWRTS